MENQNNSQDQSRQPHNLQGLLRFAVQATRSEDTTNSSQFETLDPERKQFLEDALKSLTINVVEQLEHATKIVTDGSASETQQNEALETIADFVNNIDTANDFYKIGGFCIIKPCLDSPHESIRKNTATLIGELGQNNPFCQNYLLELDILPKLVDLLMDKPRVASSAMFAISCMIRSYEPALEAFIEIGGLECILGCLENNDDRLVTKSAFLMSCLIMEYKKIRDEFIQLNAVKRIILCIKDQSVYSVKLETMLAVLNSLTEDPLAKTQCSNVSFNLEHKLNELKSTIPEPEIQEHTESIIKKCFNGTDTTDR